MDLTNLGDVKRYLNIPAGGITGIDVTDGGSGYDPTDPPTVLVSGGSGVGFAGTPLFSGDAISGVAITSQGYGYGLTPSVSFSGGSGSSAAATATADANDTAGDGILGVLVTAASAFLLQKLARRIFLSSDPLSPLTEFRNGHYGQRRIFTYEAPITAVQAVMIDGVTIAQANTPTGVGYGFDAGSVFLRGQCFTDGFSNVEIQYYAGYDPAGSEAAMAAQAACELVAQKFQRRAHIDQNTQSLQGVVTASFNQKDIPPEVQSFINKFQRVLVFG